MTEDRMTKDLMAIIRNGPKNPASTNPSYEDLAAPQAVALNAVEAWALTHNYDEGSAIFEAAFKYVLSRRKGSGLKFSEAKKLIEDFEFTIDYAKFQQLFALERRADKLEAEAKRARGHYLNILKDSATY